MPFLPYHSLAEQHGAVLIVGASLPGAVGSEIEHGVWSFRAGLYVHSMKNRVERPVVFFDAAGERIALDEETARLLEEDWAEHLEFHRWIDWENWAFSAATS